MFGKFVAPSGEWNTIEKNKSSKRLWGIRMSNDYNNIDKLAELLHDHYLTHGRTFVAVAEKVDELLKLQHDTTFNETVDFIRNELGKQYVSKL